MKRMFINHYRTMSIVICHHWLSIVPNSKWYVLTHINDQRHSSLVILSIIILIREQFPQRRFFTLMRLYVNAFNETRINWLKACSFLSPLILPSVLLVVHATRCIYATNVCSLTIHIGFVSCWCSSIRSLLRMRWRCFGRFTREMHEEFEGSKEKDRYRRYFNHSLIEHTRKEAKKDQLIDVQSFIFLFSVVLSCLFVERPRRRRRKRKRERWWWWWWTMFISTCDCQSSWSS